MKIIMISAVIAIFSCPIARADCNIVDNNGRNCVDLESSTKEKSGNGYLYRMKFRYNGGIGCPEAISVDGYTGTKNNPGTIVGRKAKNNTFVCTTSLGCDGFKGWSCH